jgi:hypothetical protein
MSEGEEFRWTRAEFEALRRELAEMRAEQRELAKAVDQLSQTFRSVAIHLGIASEPYRKRSETERERDLPGFG